MTLRHLPQSCAVGTKRNAKGYQESWIGYKLHIDAGDGGIPLSCILTSASVNDSQVAIPLATMTAERVTNLYDLMDAAYDAAEIRAHSESLGHVPIIDVNPRNNSATFKQELKQEAKAKRTLGQPYAKDVRYRERSTVERVNGRLKDEFGARQVRVRGHSKVLCHLMFGVLALTVDQLLRGELKTRLRCGHIPPVPKLFAAVIRDSSVRALSSDCEFWPSEAPLTP